MSRTRSREVGPDFRTSTLVNDFYVDGKFSHTSSTMSKPFTTYHKVETIIDVSTPNAKKIIADGGIINNPFSYTLSETRAPIGTRTSKTVTNGKTTQTLYQSGANAAYWLDYMKPVFTHATPPNIGDMLLSTRLKALAKVDSSDFAFGEDAAEISETVKTLRQGIRLIRAPLTEVRAIANRIKKASRKNERLLNMNHYDALNSAYLQYRFALTPLVKSTMDVIEVISKDLEPLVKRYASRQAERASDTSVSVVDTGPFRFTQTRVTDVEARAVILYSIIKQIGMGWQRQLGFRGKDIAPTVWAVTRLSFMVDRVFDISSALKGFANLMDSNVNILAASYSRKTVVTTTTLVEAVSQMPNPNTTITRSPHVGVIETLSVSKSRTPWVPNPFDLVPPLRVSGLVSDAFAIADLAAITYSILSGRSR